MRHLSCRGSEMRITPTALAAVANDKILAVRHIVYDLTGLLIADYGACRHAKHGVLAVFTVEFLLRTVAAIFRDEFMAVFIIKERVLPFSDAEHHVTAASAVAITADELIDLQHSVKSGYRRKGLWIMNDATLKLLRKLKDGQGNFIWQLGLLAGQPDTLLNQKVMISNYMPLPAAGNKAILYGDLSYYWLADREGRALQRLDELYAAQDQVGFKITQRVDGRLLLRESVKCLQMKAA